MDEDYIRSLAASGRRATLQNDNAKLSNAVTLLQESFSRCLNDRKDFHPTAPLSTEGSKKVGVLYVVNQLFAMYFTLNTLRLCKNLVRPVESRSLHTTSPHSADLVTYRYYVGRLYMFEDSYERAQEHLDYALRHCHKDAIRNKRAILRYFWYPSKCCVDDFQPKHYQLKEFMPLVDSIRTGDLRTFNDGLLKYQDLFIRRGIYLLLEKCKTVCYRNLFKRIHGILQGHLNLQDVAKAFKWMGMGATDLDEVECILANLIFCGYIRGYISHTKRVLVLSKSNPFPKSAVVKE